MAFDLRFTKGHGTGNDFVLFSDPEGDLQLTPAQIAAVCDRHFGVGGDGLIRAVRSDRLVDGAAAIAEDPDAAWFMDYWNADGSPSEMCGNGIRVFARYLIDHEGADAPLAIATRDGVKTLTLEVDGRLTVDMGTPRLLGDTKVGVGERQWAATHVSMGNPHAVAFVDDLADAGPLLAEPSYSPSDYPHGVNVEFVVRRGERHVAMRVHERGSGETRSCGTGACAVMVAAALADGAGRGTAYRVDVPGGRLDVTWTTDDRVLLTGPAVLVAEGNWVAGR